MQAVPLLGRYRGASTGTERGFPHNICFIFGGHDVSWSDVPKLQFKYFISTNVGRLLNLGRGRCLVGIILFFWCLRSYLTVIYTDYGDTIDLFLPVGRHADYSPFYLRPW